MQQISSGAATVSGDFVRTLSTTSFEALPAAAVHAARRGVLDWLGCACAGSGHPTVENTLSLMRTLSGRSQASVIARSEKMGLLDAPMVNGQASHVLDYDDTYMVGTVLHSGSAILPALFALAEHARCDGRSLLVSYVVGFEAAARVAHATVDHHEQGWHPTGTLGAIGASAACARLLNLDVQRFENAIGIAATQAAGLAINRGTMCKSLHAGKAAAHGLFAALLAAQGFDSAEETLTRAGGFCETFGVRVASEALVDGLGRDWAIEDNGHKPYPCAIGLHPIIEAMFELRPAVIGAIGHVERIVLYLNPYVDRYRKNDKPASSLEAKFSIPYSAAVALLDGIAGLAQYSDSRIADPAVSRLAHKVRIELDNAVQTDQARVRIQCGDREVSAVVEHASGGAANPMTDAALERKFVANTSQVLNESVARAHAQRIWNFDELNDAAQALIP